MSESETKKVRTRKLGGTDLELSEIALGFWGLSGAYGPVSESVVDETIDKALEQGITTFDVAPLWGAGEAEEKLGAKLQGKRDEAKIITRGGVVWEDNAPKMRFDVDALEADCEASLERLKTDWIDVWLLHDPPEDVTHDDAVYELASRLKAEGMIRAFGVSTSQIDVARAALSKNVDALCMPLHILHSDDHIDLQIDLDESKCGVIARSPLCHGLLTGRWTEYRRFADGDHRRERWRDSALAIRVRTVAKLRYLVHDDVTNLASAALRYVLAQPHVACAVLGARRPGQVQDLARMAGEPPYLPEEDVARIGQILASAGA